MLPDLLGRPRWYVLNGHDPLPVACVSTWAAWFAHHAHDAVVAVNTAGSITVTTRFTGMDRAYSEHAAPALFETVATDGVVTLTLGSAATWAEAAERHAGALRALAAVLPTPPAAVPSAWLASAWAALRRSIRDRAPLLFP